MFGKQKKVATTYGVIGLGRFGFALTEELAESGAEIMVLDRDEDKIRKIRELTENALVVNSRTHMESSILTTLNLVGMGIPRVISKATSPEHGEILKRLGAEVVYPEQDMAIRLANCLESSGVIDFIKLSEKINISKLTVPEALLGKSVQEVNFRARFGLNIIAIENNNEVMEYVNPDYVFREEDVLIISGSSEGIIKLTEWQK